MSQFEAAPFVRRAQTDDGPGIHEAHMRSIREVCVHVHGEDEVRGWGNRPYSERWAQAIANGETWVVDWSGVIKGVGYIKMTKKEDEVLAHIYGLYLTPEVIGKGFGAELMQLMLSVARQAGAKAVTLDSSLNAHEFYKRFGFQDTGEMTVNEIGGSKVRGFPMAFKF